MTRRSDLMCEDLFGCEHEAETPISDTFGEIIEWRCRCGLRVSNIDYSAEQRIEDLRMGA